MNLLDTVALKECLATLQDLNNNYGITNCIDVNHHQNPDYP